MNGVKHWRGKLLNRRSKHRVVDMKQTACGGAQANEFNTTKDPTAVTCKLCLRSVTFREHQRRVGTD